MVFRLVIEFWGIGKGGTKKRGAGKRDGGDGSGMWAAGFCGPFVCWGVFLL
jgi:hypothetical protein